MSTADVLIMGGGFSGQLMAHLMAQRGFSVTLCEAEKVLGGSCRVDLVDNIPIDVGLNVNLLTPTQAETLGLHTPWCESKSGAPKFFEKKEWVDADPAVLSEAQKHFHLSQFSLPQGGIKHIFDFFQKASMVETVLSQPIQEAHINESVIQSVKSVAQAFEAKAFVSTLPFSTMLGLFGEENFHKNVLKKLKKQSYVPAVKLDFILNKKISDQKEILFDVENNGVGFWTSNVDPSIVDNGRQLIQWLFFLTDEEVSQKEEIAKKIRAGKRFIKKAYPEFPESIHWERITVFHRLFPEKTVGAPLEKEWTSIKNLYWVSDIHGGPSVNGNTLVEHAITTADALENHLKTT